MAKCDVCGNDYDKSFQVTQYGRTMTFDSFECAIHSLAPRCAHCACRVIGHGVEADGTIFCCAHCARHGGETGLTDRTSEAAQSRSQPRPAPGAGHMHGAPAPGIHDPVPRPPDLPPSLPDVPVR